MKTGNYHSDANIYINLSICKYILFRLNLLFGNVIIISKARCAFEMIETLLTSLYKRLVFALPDGVGKAAVISAK